MNPRYTILVLLLPLIVLLLPLAAAAQPVPCVDGFAGPYACSNVDLLSQPSDEGATDIWGWTDPVTGVEYAIVFYGLGPHIFDLSDPAAPFEVARLEGGGQDARVYADHLFFVGDGGQGMVVFDLKRLRDVENPPVTLSANTTYTGIQGAHNLSLDPESGFAYPVLTVDSDLCAGELHIVDLRNLRSPRYAGCFDSPTFDHFHDAHCITYDGPDADYTGRELCFGSAGLNRVLAIVDVTDKSNPVLISEAPYPNAAYTHQGWLTEDSRYFLLDDELDEMNLEINTRTVVFDVSDLDEPEFAFEYVAETAASDHNLFVKGDYAYQANYTAGFRMLDLTEIDSGVLTEAAFFDTYPEEDGAILSGAWGVYPFFESGIVVVSDLARGLFVLQPRLGTTTEAEAVPDEGVSLAVYPNPFAAHATVTLDIAAVQHLRVAVYDVLGREVAVLHDGLLGAGEEHALTLDGAGLPTGAYIVRVTGETFETSRAITLVR
ncbi:MAG: choice-of-anchor B family protein [Rhodothermales bacterium]